MTFQSEDFLGSSFVESHWSPMDYFSDLHFASNGIHEFLTVIRTGLLVDSMRFDGDEKDSVFGIGNFDSKRDPSKF